MNSPTTEVFYSRLPLPPVRKKRIALFDTSASQLCIVSSFEAIDVSIKPHKNVRVELFARR